MLLPCEKGLLALYDGSVGNDATGPSLVKDARSLFTFSS